VYKDFEYSYLQRSGDTIIKLREATQGVEPQIQQGSNHRGVDTEVLLSAGKHLPSIRRSTQENWWCFFCIFECDTINDAGDSTTTIRVLINKSRWDIL